MVKFNRKKNRRKVARLQSFCIFAFSIKMRKKWMRKRYFWPSYTAIIDVGTEDEAVATILLEPAGKQFGSAHCHAAYDEVVGAGVKGVAQGFVALDATAPFDIE